MDSEELERIFAQFERVKRAQERKEQSPLDHSETSGRGAFGRDSSLYKMEDATLKEAWRSLGLPGPVGKDEARKAYHKALQKVYPDLNPDKPKDLQHEEVIKIRTAWDEIRKAMRW